MRKVIALIAGVFVLVIGLAAPANAATTTVTFTINAAGGLQITAPAAVNLGTASSGTPKSGAIGPVQVTDQRGQLVGAWTASVISTSFTTGGATADETVPASAVNYWSGPATATTGLGVVVPGQLTALLAVPIDTSKTAFSKAIGAGNNSTTWNPTLVINIPASAVNGVYTGTVTHSVA